MYANSSPAIRTQGFIGAMSGGSVKNLSISNSYVYNGATDDVSFAGGILGYTEKQSVVEHYSFSGTVDGNSAGGIVGSAANTTVTACSNSGTIIGRSSCAEGVAASYASGVLSDCSNSGPVNCNGSWSYCGGVVGRMSRIDMGPDTFILNCFNSGAVSGDFLYRWCARDYLIWKRL